ncbi:SdpI family protein [Lacinutrix salivirga]
MKSLFKKDVLLLIIVAIPFAYLAYLWNDLPETVPIHWNEKGEIDGYGSKITLWLIPILLPLLVFILFSIIPKIDPKGQIKKMGNKYGLVKFLLTTFMSVLAIFIIYSSKSQSLTNPKIILLFIGFLYLILGNYMKTFKPNYFVGVRTPWTLENETVWKATHKMAGKLWLIGGLSIIILSMVLSTESIFTVFIVITIIIAVIPIVYSYLKFKKLKRINS